MILLFLFKVDYLLARMSESTTLFSQLLPDELDLLVLLLSKLFKFCLLEILQTSKVAVPSLLKLKNFLLVGLFNGLFLRLMNLLNILDLSSAQH